MRITYRGNFQPTLPAAKRVSTEWQVALELESLGHRVFRVQESATDWATTIALATASDLFLWTTTQEADQAGGHDAISAIRDAGIPSASFHLDLFWGLARQVKVAEPFFRTDVVVTADGGHDKDWADAGVTHLWMPPAIWSGYTTQTGRWREDYARFPVAFVGSFPYPHVEHADARRAIIGTCQRVTSSGFRLYRYGVRGQDLTDLCASATVIVGDSCLAGRVARYWSDRIPETLGRGGFLIHPYVEGIEDWYVDGKHLRLYEPGDMHALESLIRYYLERPEQARKIAAAGRAVVAERDTYRHRMTDLLDLVSVP